MNLRWAVFVLCLVAVPMTGAASERGAWTLSGNGGISLGDQTPPSFAWWGAIHHWVRPAVGIGIEAGRHRWEARPALGGIRAEQSFLDDFNTLSRGGQELQHLSASLRLRGPGSTSAPALTLGAGAYRQVVRDSRALAMTDGHNGMMRPGWSIALGGAGVRGIAPGAEFRFDWVDTAPGPSTYFTAALGMHFNL